MENTKKLEKLEKEIDNKITYFIGKDKKNIEYYISEPIWECGWYWSFGKIYTSDESYLHFKGLMFDFFGINSNNPDLLLETPFTDNEKWLLLELFQTAYDLKNITGVYLRGGSHISNNPLKEIIKNKDECDRINKILLPEIFKEIKKIITPTEIKDKS